MKNFNLVIICTAIILSLGCTSKGSAVKIMSDSTAWQRIGPGGGGATFIPTFSYHNGSEFLVKCDMTGSYLTRNGGEDYQLINISGGVSAFSYDPLDSNTVYIGSAVLSKSVDGGKSWKQIFPRQSEMISEKFIGDHADYEIEVADTSLYVKNARRISTIKADPVTKGKIYFSMGNYFFFSADAGISWQRQDMQQPITCLYTNVNEAKDQVYIFTDSTIFIFNKNAQKLDKRSIPAAFQPAQSYSAGKVKNSEKTLLYALHHDFNKQNPWDFGHSTIILSEDMGIHWKVIGDTLAQNRRSGIHPSYTMIACSEYDAANAYVVTNRYEEKLNNKTTIQWYGALKTGDGGKTWNWVWKGGGGSGQYGVQDASDAKNLQDAWVHKAFGGEFIQLFDAGVSPQNGDLAIVTDWYRTMKTADGGKTWREIYSRTNSDSSFSSRGLDVTTNYGVHFDPFDKNHLAISYTDIGFHHSFDGGKSWNRSVTGVPVEWVNTCYWVVFDPKIKGRLWSAWSGLHDFPRGKMTRNPLWRQNGRGGICVSDDGGKTWRPTVEGMGTNSPATSIVIDTSSPAGNRTLYASVFSKGVFKSIDNGKTWQLKNRGIDSNTCAFELTLASNGALYLTVSPTPAHKDGKKGPEIYSGAVYRSTDGAENWTRLTISKGLLFPNGIEVDPSNPNRVYLACWSTISLSDLVGNEVAHESGGNRNLDMQGGIFLSEDGGNTWISIFDPTQYVYDVTVDPYHPGRIYCNTFNKVAWRSDNKGKTWQKIKGYDFHWGHRIIPDPNDKEKIYITTYGSSVWHGIPDTNNK